MDGYILCGPGRRQQLGVLDRFCQGRCPVSRRHAERRDPVITHGHLAAQHSEARGDLSYSSSGTRKPSSLLQLGRALGQGLSWEDVLHAGRVGSPSHLHDVEARWSCASSRRQLPSSHLHGPLEGEARLLDRRRLDLRGVLSLEASLPFTVRWISS